MRELGEVKDALDMEVKQNFIDPLQNLHEKDLKEIQVRVQSFDAQTDRQTNTQTNKQQKYIIDLLVKSRIQIDFRVVFSQHHLKKMEGRRLDFDYKKKRQGKVNEDEIKQALEKFDESKEIAEQSMFNLLESDVRMIFSPWRRGPDVAVTGKKNYVEAPLMFCFSIKTAGYM